MIKRTVIAAERHYIGSPLCQDAARDAVLGLVVTGPGSGLSEESVSGCESATLDVSALPGCPPGPAAAGVSMSVSSCRYTMSDRRRLSSLSQLLRTVRCRA